MQFAVPNVVFTFLVVAGIDPFSQEYARGLMKVSLS